MADFWAKQHDTSPAIKETLVGGNGLPVNLAGSEVRFFMKHLDDLRPPIAGVANIDQVGDGSDGSMGRVSYDWQVGDLDVAGGYKAEWQVTFTGAGGLVETFPNDRSVLVAVIPDLGPVTGS
jgi:hypothetical protein